MRFCVFVKNLIENKKSGETVADIINKVKTSAPVVFNRDAKLRHREKYAIFGDHDNKVIKTMTSNLLDRLKDTTRKFNDLAILCGYSDYVLRDLKKYRNDINNVTCLEPSEKMMPLLKKYDENINIIKCNEERIYLEEDSVDLIISHLGLHWVNDLQGCLKQCRLALKPDGMFLGSMIGGHSLQELRISLNMAEQKREGGMSIRVSPFVKISDVGSLLTEAGFKLMSIDIDNITIKYKNIYELINQLKIMGETNACVHKRNRLYPETLKLAANIYYEKFKEKDDLIPATFQIIYMIGWSPAPTQPQPLKRGSATKSLENLDEFMNNIKFKTLEPEE